MKAVYPYSSFVPLRQPIIGLYYLCLVKNMLTRLLTKRIKYLVSVVSLHNKLPLEVGMSMPDLILAILALVPGCPKVKLAKLLLYVEREYYKQYGTSLTDTYYVRKDMGPVPANFDRILDTHMGTLWSNQLQPLYKQDGEIAGYGNSYNALVKLQVQDDLQHIMDKVMLDYASLSGARLSELSHQLPAWRYAEPGEPIFIEELVMDTEEQYFALIETVAEMEDDEDGVPEVLSSLVCAVTK